MRRYCLVVGAVACLCFPAAASALIITGFGDIGMGVRASDGGTVPGSGELGNFEYVQFTADTPIALSRATFNFTGHDLEVGGGPSFVATVNNGVATFTRFGETVGSQVFGFTATGFDSGDSLMLGLDLDKISIGHTGSPLQGDYLGGTLTVEFAGGPTLVGTFVPMTGAALGDFNARASFSSQSDGGPEVPEPCTVLIWSLLATLFLLVGWCRRRKAA